MSQNKLKIPIKFGECWSTSQKMAALLEIKDSGIHNPPFWILFLCHFQPCGVL